MKSLTGSESIFDSIRRFDEQGNEFWLARELMSVLGYRKWERFASVVEIAKENLEAIAADVESHASLYWEASGKTKRENYKLSRLASYHIALCCDSRGNEQVKLAKHYFAVKTREAETVIPAQSDRIRELELQLAIASQQNQANQAALESKKVDNAMLTMHGAPIVLALRGMSDQVIETEKKTLEVIDERTGAKFYGMSGTQIKDLVAKKYGIKYKSGADVIRHLEAKDMGHLVAQTPRRVLSDYIPEEFLDEAIKVLTDCDRQLLLGES